MTIENISVGMTIKNYKELCGILGVEIAAGNTKKAQLKEFERYFAYHKMGNKFIIDEIFKTPKEKIENRGKTHSIYSKFIQKLILDLLVQQKQNNTNNIYLSTCKLLERLNMINENYNDCRDNIPVLAEFLEMDEDCVYDFYNLTYGSLKETLESALNILSNKSLIIWNSTLTVCLHFTIIDDEENEVHIEDHRPATEDESELIMEVEKRVLNELGFKCKRDVVVCRRWKEFIFKVNKILKQISEIQYYYKAYDIIFNRKYIEEEQQELEQFLLENNDRIKTKKELNKTIVEKYKQNGEKRHNNTIEKTKVSFGKPNYTQKESLRVDEDYIKNNNKLVDTLINERQGNIRYKMNKKHKENQAKAEKELEEFLENF